MNVHVRINAFVSLGQSLQQLSDDDFQTLTEKVARENPWFTKENVRMAIHGVVKLLDKPNLEKWLSQYQFKEESKKIALVLAGNIPMVGFHDLLSVLISGNVAVIKLSSKDTVLLNYILNTLCSIEPSFRSRIELVEQLKNFDAVIATGSDNSARYFDYYFSKYPHVIRKNRTSVAILTGNESEEDLINIGVDIFSYFGLGCRNVSKIFLPTEYTFDKFYPSLERYQPIINHHKYCNNYDYQKSIMLVNQIPFLDNGFLMLHESTRMVSPISVVYYERYANREELSEKLKASEDKIQCVVGKDAGMIPFGKAQYPELWDYADGVDTLKFLSQLN